MQPLPSHPLDEEIDTSRISLSASFGQRSELEWRLYHRGGFAPEYHTLPIVTLTRIDAMFERLQSANGMDDAIRTVQDAFVHEDERRSALVPLLGLLYPLAYFDDKMLTPDIVRLVAHHERRKPAKPL
jgi:hypothetical protein